MAFTAVPAAGAYLRAATLSALVTELRPLVGRKGSSETRTSTATPAADADLTIAAPANTDWDFELFLVLTSVANAAGDFSGRLSFPSGSSVTFGAHALDLALASAGTADLRSLASGTDSTSPSSTWDAGCSTTPTLCLVVGRWNIGATPGSLTLEWSQQASNGNGTTIVGGSRLTARRVD